jgi:hypothetical protein
MPAHNTWFRRGVDRGIFLVVGSVQPALGGAIIATGIPRGEPDATLQEDSFVSNDVVMVEVFDGLSRGRTTSCAPSASGACTRLP